jgi:hypothetical protein
VNAIPGIADGAVPPAVADWLAQAVAAYHNTERAEFLLCTAQALAPDCLPVYFAMYKFYFYKLMLPQAEEVALQALDLAARQGGFSPDWPRLDACSTDWQRVDAPQHFYLFTLKALAFIRLRRGQAEDSQAILAKLQELDPLDTVGASVIRDLAAS